MLLNKKIVIFDLDGTITESKQELSEKTAGLIFKLALQKKVAIISGASFVQFEKQFLSAWNKFFGDNVEVNKNLIILPTSGAQCYEFDSQSQKWIQVYALNFPQGVKEQVIKILGSIIESGEFEVPKEHFGEYIEDRQSEINFSALGQNAPSEKKKIWDPDQVKRLKIRSEIEKNISQVSVSVAGTTSIDILPLGEDKGVAVVKLIERLRIGLTEAVYVGDALYVGGNDHPVIKTGIETISVSGVNDTEVLLQSWVL